MPIDRLSGGAAPVATPETEPATPAKAEMPLAPSSPAIATPVAAPGVANTDLFSPATTPTTFKLPHLSRPAENAAASFLPSNVTLDAADKASNDYFNGQRMVVATQMMTAQAASWRQVSATVADAIDQSAAKTMEQLTKAGLSPAQAGLVRSAADRAAAKVATRTLVWGGARPDAQVRAVEAVRNAVQTNVTKSVAKMGEASAVKVAGQLATELGDNLAEAVAVAGPRVARMDGGFVRRFIPGLNIALLAWDAHRLIEVQKDDKATPMQKISAWVTVAASGLAATDVPVLSWIGAGVGVASSFLRDNAEPIKAFDEIMQSVAGSFTKDEPAPATADGAGGGK